MNTNRSLWTLRMAFRLDENMSIQSFEGCTRELAGHKYRFAYHASSYVLLIDDFESYDEAEAFVPRAWRAMHFFAATICNGIEVDLEISRFYELEKAPHESAEDVMRRRAEGRIACLISAGSTSIYPTGSCVVLNSGGFATFNGSIGMESFIKHFAEGLELDPIAIPLARWELACSLFSASHFERSQSARLLLYTGSLEALCERNKQEAAVQEVVAKLVSLVRGNLPETSQARDSLENSVRGLARESISAAVQRLIVERLQGSLGEGELREVLTQFKEAYAVRSRLSHGTKSEAPAVAEACATMLRLLSRLLRSYLPRNG